MSNEKSAHVAAPAMSVNGTFRALLIERAQALSALQQIDRALLRKCLDEGWDDCVSLNYSRIERRVK